MLHSPAFWLRMVIYPCPFQGFQWANVPDECFSIVFFLPSPPEASRTFCLCFPTGLEKMKLYRICGMALWSRHDVQPWPRFRIQSGYSSELKWSGLFKPQFFFAYNIHDSNKTSLPGFYNLPYNRESAWFCLAPAKKHTCVCSMMLMVLRASGHTGHHTKNLIARNYQDSTRGPALSFNFLVHRVLNVPHFT